MEPSLRSGFDASLPATTERRMAINGPTRRDDKLPKQLLAADGKKRASRISYPADTGPENSGDLWVGEKVSWVPAASRNRATHGERCRLGKRDPRVRRAERVVALIGEPAAARGRVGAAREIIVVDEAGKPTRRDESEVLDAETIVTSRIEVRPHPVDRCRADGRRAWARGRGHGDAGERGVGARDGRAGGE